MAGGVLLGGERVGTVTSALWSPRLEKNIGYAWLPVEHAELGSQVVVETPDNDRSATVVPMPFVDPGKQIPVKNGQLVLTPPEPKQ